MVVTDKPTDFERGIAAIASVFVKVNQNIYTTIETAMLSTV